MQLPGPRHPTTATGAAGPAEGALPPDLQCAGCARPAAGRRRAAKAETSDRPSGGRAGPQGPGLKTYRRTHLLRLLIRRSARKA